MNYRTRSGNVAEINLIYKDTVRFIGVRWRVEPSTAEREELRAVLGVEPNWEQTSPPGGNDGS